MTPSGRTVTAVVAEDEPVLAGELCARLAALWPDLRIAGVAVDGAEALGMYDRLQPDILFLDINMPGPDGLEVARRVGSTCHIVFITAYDSHAVSAFDRGAVDYLLKPYDDARLALALRRVRERLSRSPADIEAIVRELARAVRPGGYLQWIKALRGSEVELITVGEVTHFQAETKYTTVHTERREALIRRSLSDLEDELDPQRFWRIHRATIVNVEAIASVGRSLGGMSVRLRNRPERLPVSEPYRRLFRHM